MALIKLGPMVGGISGSIAATTFARNRAGYYARARTKPKIPVSLKRDAAQQRLSQTVDDWHLNLGIPQRQLWTDKGALQSFTNKVGDAYVPTGLNLYVKANTLLRETGQTVVIIPPVTPIAPVFAPVLTWTTLVGIQITAIGGFDDALTGKILWRYTLSLPTSKNFFKGPWEHSNYTAISAIATLPLSLLASASLVASTRVFFQFRVVTADGATSAPIVTHCDVGLVP